ncbi:hypothetical protein SteCoe_22569 [Stentor coeruleus]|uniref:Thioredoxin-like fold domain-containing protein n=1 Tax=Stentor coeruleus TaxID=5963 RepID=A0A1R2BLZ0_9CILI|nr:hypothetical protein SteCoe_22569 [Stentor coeruleus]
MKAGIIFVLAALTFAQQVQPIPGAMDGISYGSLAGNTTLDVFFDHLCDGSAEAWPGLYSFWSSNQDWLRMVIHIYPLPYHYYSFSVGEAGRFIQTMYPANFTSFLSWFFQHQSKYLDAAQAWDQSQLYTNLAHDTQTATGVPFSLTEEALNKDSYDWSLRVSWKYAASKGITGTPQYMVNGIWTPGASNCVTVQDWQSFFSSLY